jgi:hypothetical protein
MASMNMYTKAGPEPVRVPTAAKSSSLISIPSPKLLKRLKTISLSESSILPEKHIPSITFPTKAGVM